MSIIPPPNKGGDKEAAPAAPTSPEGGTAPVSPPTGDDDAPKN